MNIKVLEMEIAPEAWNAIPEIAHIKLVISEEMGFEEECIQLRRYKGTDLCQLYYRSYDGWEPTGDLYEVKQ